MESRPQTPPFPPPCHQILLNAAAELRADAENFSREMECAIFQMEATRDREITARVDYLKAAETDGDNHARLKDLHEEVEALSQEARERVQHVLTMVRAHRAFLSATAAAVERCQSEFLQ